MSPRNFILLIIILGLGAIAALGFWYFRPGTIAPEDAGTGTNFVSQFKPFGDSKPVPGATTPATGESDYQPNPVETGVKMQLTKVSSVPVAGFVVFSKERLKEVAISPPLGGGGEGSVTPNPPPTPPKGKGTKPTPPPTEFAPALRYVEKKTGNIYQTFADKIEERKFSVTVIPKVYEAYFGNHGQSVIMRYLKANGNTIETIVGTLPKELLGGDTTENNEVKGVFLPDNIQDISISPDTTKIFYLWSSGGSLGDNMIGITLNLLNNKKTQLFDSPLTEWLSVWGNNNMITLSTKPFSSAPGYMYSMDGSGKNLTKILGGVNGLTTKGSPNGKLVLFSDSNLSLRVYHTDTRNSDTLSLRTLPEKCVWGKASDAIYCAVPKSISSGAYPDSWYQGEVSFSDQFWKIDLKTGNATLIIDPMSVSGGEEVDGTKLALDESENYLFFVNKKDSFLWELDLK